jgi:hypothetical protein
VLDPAPGCDFETPLLPCVFGIHRLPPSLLLYPQYSYVVATLSSPKLFLTCSYFRATLWLMARSRRKARAAVKPLKDDVVRMRIPTAQKQALLEAAARDGLELSAWLRQLALRAAGLLPET